jgi:hypothetical protein
MRRIRKKKNKKETSVEADRKTIKNVNKKYPKKTKQNKTKANKINIKIKNKRIIKIT